MPVDILPSGEAGGAENKDRRKSTIPRLDVAQYVVEWNK